MMGYQKMISQVTGIEDWTKLEEIEECMRQDIFHSTLDWQSPEIFAKGAKEAVELLELWKTKQQST